MAKQTSPRPKGRKKFPKQPVVFMFQPTHYEVTPPEKLTEWEAAMSEHVGLKVQSAAGARMARPGGGTQTCCLCGEWNWDDCDEV